MNCHGHGKSATTNSKAGDYPKTFGKLTKIPKFLKIHHLVKRELFITFHIYVSLLEGRSENVGKLQHHINLRKSCSLFLNGHELGKHSLLFDKATGETWKRYEKIKDLMTLLRVSMGRNRIPIKFR